MIARLILLLLFIPTLAFARSGGSFGGGFNSSKSSAPAKSYSTPARSYSAPALPSPSRSWTTPSQARSAPQAPAKTWATPSAPRRIYVPSRATSTRESHDGLATLVGIGIGYGLRHAQSRPAMVHVPVYAPRPVYTPHTYAPQYDPNFVGPVLPVEESNAGWVLLGFLAVGTLIFIGFWVFIIVSDR
jgi:hypothetical protein